MTDVWRVDTCRARPALRRPAALLVIAAAILIVALYAQPALAQTADPFATAVQAACAFQRKFVELASAVGMIGITICLMLGFYNKLNWRWLSTGIGVSFALGVVPSWIMSLAGGGC